ncbi:hypothetical protein TVAG_310950 [Trichomonas vaginalis G3]|uniref:Uncharacterized protein n=1 Tax=Trichomonas vaginalis (strain ATCC PRA-98 / G3) TaxID=412133 RepID=A2FHV0_TRIV3|nr:hypothetical protein TVAG_310950 [Trichomonas vaginalis G3]|eukprot:XP_001308453.1 hypothetical protein [Trichomonas vaginalis G3]
MFYFVVNASIKNINKFPLSEYIEEMNKYLSTITDPHPFYVASLIDWVKQNQIENPQLVTSNFIDALDYMQKILNEYPTLRDNEMLSEISGPLTPFLMNLDPLPLLFLSKIAPCFDEDLFKPLVQFIFKGFSKIEDEELVNLKFNFEDLPKTSVFLDMKEEVTRFQPSSTAFDKIFDYKYPNIDKLPAISTLIPKPKLNILKIVGLIANNLQNCSIPCIIQTFEKINENQKIPQYLDLCLFLTIVSSSINFNSLQNQNSMVSQNSMISQNLNSLQNVSSQNIYKSLIDTIIFNPSITIFETNLNESINNLLLVRSFCIKSIFKYPNLIAELFDRNVKYPEMFCELVLRLKESISEVSDEAFISSKLMHSFSTSMRYSIHNAFKDNQRIICEKNVCSIFTFLKELEKQKVNNPNIIKSWLSNEEFIFISLIALIVISGDCLFSMFLE